MKVKSVVSKLNQARKRKMWFLLEKITPSRNMHSSCSTVFPSGSLHHSGSPAMQSPVNNILTPTHGGGGAVSLLANENAPSYWATGIGSKMVM
jgi:hypothetical protein